MRAVPCTTWPALSAFPAAWLSRSEGLSANEDDRATTPRPRTAASATAISSVMPPAKKSCVASPELFSSGSTASFGAWPLCASAGAVPKSIARTASRTKPRDCATIVGVICPSSHWASLTMNNGCLPPGFGSAVLPLQGPRGAPVPRDQQTSLEHFASSCVDTFNCPITDVLVAAMNPPLRTCSGGRALCFGTQSLVGHRTAPLLQEPLPEATTLDALRAEEAICTRCPLYQFATQVV